MEMNFFILLGPSEISDKSDLAVKNSAISKNTLVTLIPGRISMVMMTLLTLMAMFSGVRQSTPKVSFLILQIYFCEIFRFIQSKLDFLNWLAFIEK